MNQSNEKAPVATNEQGPCELRHLQDSTDYDCCQEPVDPVIPELIEITKRLHELRDKGIIFDIDSAKSQAHMPSNKFPDLFGFGGWEEESHAPKFDTYSTTVQGVEFFCLIEKEVEQDV